MSILLGETFDPLSPSEVEAYGGMSEDGSYFSGLVTREPQVDEYKIVFNRKAAVCVYDPGAQRANVLTCVFSENYIFQGALSSDGSPIDPGILAVGFMQAVRALSQPGETVVMDIIQNPEGEGILSNDFTVSSPEELYHFLARMTLGVIESLPDPAREVARTLNLRENVGLSPTEDLRVRFSPAP